MKIAFLTPEYPHFKVEHAAGLGTSVKNLVSALVSEGVEVTVFVYGQSSDEMFEEEGIHFHLIEDRKYRFGKWYFYRKHIQKYVNKIIAQEGIQLLEAPDWTGITAFMRFSVPLVIRFHGSDTYFCHLENRKQKKKNYFFEKRGVMNAQAYIAPTKYAGEVTGQLFGLDPQKIKTIHYGLELDNFRNESPGEFEEGLILYIGTIIRKKGVFELPAIFNKVREKYPKAKLVLIGSDSNDIRTGASSTWELVRANFNPEDLTGVYYLGKMPYQEVKEYIKKAHLCVFPTYAETLGMVTIESMAMKKPVVNSNFGWANELINNGESGYLVHPSNHQEYADKIILLLSDLNLANQMGEMARKSTEQKFDISKIVSQNIEFYNKTIQLK